MKLGRVCGTVIATVKSPALEGVTLRLMYPAKVQTSGGETAWAVKPIVAVDTVGSREGDTIIWISAREATLALTDCVIPTDASIVGIVDEM
jgi:ethanolamine utilization protein EutN